MIKKTVIFIVTFLLSSTCLFAQVQYFSKDTLINGNEITMKIESKTGALHRIYGTMRFVEEGQEITSQNIEDLNEQFIEKYCGLFRIVPQDLKLIRCEKSTDVWGNDRWTISYRQIYKNVPLYRSEIGYTIHENGNIVSLGSNFAHPYVSVGVIPDISETEALLTAKNKFKELINVYTPGIRKQPELMILPVEGESEYSYHLVYNVALEYFETGCNCSQEYFIDAVDNFVVSEFSNIMDDYRKVVIARVPGQCAGIPFKIILTPRSINEPVSVFINCNFNGTYPKEAQVISNTAPSTFTITADELKTNAEISIIQESNNDLLVVSNTFNISSLTNSDISAPSNLNAFDLPCDDGGYVKLQFTASANHPGMHGDTDDNIPIDYYIIYRNSADTSFQNAVEWAVVSLSSLIPEGDGTVTVTVSTEGDAGSAWYWVCAAKGDCPQGVSGNAVLNKNNSSVSRIISSPTGKNSARPINNTNAALQGGADLNGDSIVDILDIGALLDVLDESSEYDPCMDLNNDGNIDILDIGNILDKFH